MLRCIHDDPRLELLLVVTGMHLVSHYGETVCLVEASGLPIGARVDMLLAGDSRSAMAKGVGLAVIGITQALEQLAPDVVLLLGDRGEMLAGAIAAVHLRIPVAHCHGGEVSGSVDELVRHAISKLAHVHFVATPSSAERLLRLGERREYVFVTGAPGLDAALREPALTADAVRSLHGLAPDRPWGLVIYHPDTGVADSGAEMDGIIAGLGGYDGQLVVFEPNSDTGRQAIVERLEKLANRPNTVVLKNVSRPAFLGLLAYAQFLVGNSSSGIIEAPSFGVPAVNVGRRQDGRERGDNVLDVRAERRAIAAGVARACGDAAFLDRVARRRNPYGDGKAGERIAETLAGLRLGPKLLDKRLSY